MTEASTSEPVESHGVGVSLRAGLAPIAVVAASVAGGLHAFTDYQSDDWAYLDWAKHADTPFAFVMAPPPFPYFRPLNALVWQCLGRDSPWPIQCFHVALWGVACGALWVLGRRRAGTAGALLCVMLALATLEFRGLAGWRSWTTSTGELAGVLVGLALAERRRFVLALVAVAIGAGFKELAWWYAGLAFLGVGAWPIGVVSLAGFALHAAYTLSLDAGGVSPSFVVTNLAATGATFAHWIWPCSLALAALLSPRLRDWRLPLAACVSCAPALCFYLPNPTYLLESGMLWLVGLVGPAVHGARSVPRAGVVVAVGTCILLLGPAHWRDMREDLPWQWHRMEGRALARAAAGASAVWAPDDDVGASGLARDLLVYRGATRLPQRPSDGRALTPTLVVR